MKDEEFHGSVDFCVSAGLVPWGDPGEYVHTVTGKAFALTDDAAETWEPTADDLAAFVGRYFSDEIETFYTLSVEDEGLVLHQRRLDDINLTSGERDTYAGGGFTLSFERDRNGRIVAFYVSNGRTRDVRFGRLN